MAATSCGSILNKCSLTMHLRFCTLSLIGAKSIKSGMNRLGPMFPQEAKANTVAI